MSDNETESKYDSLGKKYPKLYSITSYFSCGEGWYELIDQLSQKLETINNSFSDPEDKIVAAQIKEKFGGLRFYVNYPESYYNSDDNTNLEVHAKTKDAQVLINAAEGVSFLTCESCGDTGSTVGIKGRGWITTRCDKCGNA